MIQLRTGIKQKLKARLETAWLFCGWIAGSARQALSSNPRGEKKILFVLDDDRLYRDGDGSGRYVYLILNLFREAGYAVYLHKKIGFGDYRRLGKYGREIYGIPNLKLVDKVPGLPETFVFAFDDERDRRGLLALKWKKIVYVNVLKSPECRVGKVVWIPYFMHMRLYANGKPQRLSPLRKNLKKIRIFFGGNTTPVYYKNPDLHRYGHTNRFETVEFLAQSRIPWIRITDDPQQFKRGTFEKPYTHQCQIVKTDHTFPIPPPKWIDLVSEANFFLCLSGTDLPMCHHTIEALAVGTVPVIAYPDWFSPPLEHNKNALIYSGHDDLLKVLTRAMEMPEAEIDRMRGEAARYYDEHLTPSAFERSLGSSGDVCTIMLHPRFRPTERETEEGAGSLSELRHRLNGSLKETVS